MTLSIEELTEYLINLDRERIHRYWRVTAERIERDIYGRSITVPLNVDYFDLAVHSNLVSESGMLDDEPAEPLSL